MLRGPVGGGSSGLIRCYVSQLLCNSMSGDLCTSKTASPPSYVYYTLATCTMSCIVLTGGIRWFPSCGIKGGL